MTVSELVAQTKANFYRRFDEETYEEKIGDLMAEIWKDLSHEVENLYDVELPSYAPDNVSCHDLMEYAAILRLEKDFDHV